MASSDSSISVTTDPTQPTVEEASEAYHRVEPELASIEPPGFVRITTDVSKSVVLGMGAAPRIQEYRAVIVRDLPSFPIAKLDKLRDYALAAFYADAAATPAPIDPALAALLAEAAQLRERMLAASETMVVFGILDGARVASIRGGSGHVDTAKDLTACSAMFKENWAKLEGKQPITREEVERASKLGTKLALALGPKAVRAQVGEPAAVAADDRRARAFTLFVNAYQECRDAITYLRRREGDADVIAPSLFVRNRRRAAAPADETDPTQPGPAPAPIAPNGGPSA